jgi:predicted metal-dependent phosphotriesterase family hydrolase
MTISTVLGPVPTDTLGVTMMHEHFALALSPVQTVDDMDALKQELAHLASYGCRTIVELSNIGMGRDVTRLATLARTTHANIIAATGFYVQAWHPAWVAERSIEELTQLMVDELQHGIDGTDIRAGVIGEIGTSKESITPDEEKVMRAAARAHLRTGRPISTHTSLGNLPLEQLELLENEGVELRYVVIGHLDLSPQFETVLQVARRGAFVQFDTFGKESYQPDEVRITRLLDMVEAGFGDRLLISCDISRNSYMKRHGGYGYDHFLRVIVPELRRRGLDETALQAILVDNPRRFLEGRADG